jgi:hypothetical protein
MSTQTDIMCTHRAHYWNAHYWTNLANDTVDLKPDLMDREIRTALHTRREHTSGFAWSHSSACSRGLCPSLNGVLVQTVTAGQLRVHMTISGVAAICTKMQLFTLGAHAS